MVRTPMRHGNRFAARVPSRTVSQDQPERPGVTRFVHALDVPRNAKIGFATGIVLAGVLTIGAVTGPPGQYPAVAYVGLGFVLAVAVGLLVTLLLTLVSAYRLARST